MRRPRPAGLTRRRAPGRPEGRRQTLRAARLTARRGDDSVRVVSPRAYRPRGPRSRAGPASPAVLGRQSSFQRLGWGACARGIPRLCRRQRGRRAPADPRKSPPSSRLQRLVSLPPSEPRVLRACARARRVTRMCPLPRRAPTHGRRGRRAGRSTRARRAPRGGAQGSRAASCSWPGGLKSGHGACQPHFRVTHPAAAQRPRRGPQPGARAGIFTCFEEGPSLSRKGRRSPRPRQGGLRRLASPTCANPEVSCSRGGGRPRELLRQPPAPGTWSRPPGKRGAGGLRLFLSPWIPRGSDRQPANLPPSGPQPGTQHGSAQPSPLLRPIAKQQQRARRGGGGGGREVTPS